MKTLFRFAKTTLLGGLVFMTPLLVALIIVQQALKQLSKVIKPFAEWIQMKSMIGIQAPYLLACLVLLLLCFLAGLAAKTQIGVSVRDAADRWLTAHVPGYVTTKKMTPFGAPTRVPVKKTSALVLLGDSWHFAFLMDRPKPGWSTVFVPNAPGANAGSIHLVSDGRVKTLDVPPEAVSQCLANLGADSGNVLEKEATLPEERHL